MRCYSPIGRSSSLAAWHEVCLLWDGELPQGCDHITTGIIHKRIAKRWAEAKSMARELYTY